MIKGDDKKYVWWGLLGIGVAAFFYFLSQGNQKQQTNTVTVPYLVPQTSTGASPTADTSLSNQPNIIGNSPNSTIPNGTNPLGGPNPFETPGQYGYLPQLTGNIPKGVNNAITFGAFTPVWNGAYASPFPMNWNGSPNTTTAMLPGHVNWSGNPTTWSEPIPATQ